MSFKRLLKRVIEDEENITLIDSSPLLLMHLLAIGVLFTGFSWVALGVCIFLYWLRVFALTAGYHRYFSHRSYRTSRWFQFIIAWTGAMSAQCGPLWWASHHRHHHKHSDQEDDVHSPVQRGFIWAHIGWLMCRKYADPLLDQIKDFARFPELRFLDRFHIIPPVLLGFSLFFIGKYLPASWGTSGWQMLFWGFFLSTVLVYHATFCINSLTHVMGSRRFNTDDDSRNNLFTSLITMGEGWHNNHHRYPVSTRQGFYWWEIDCTYYVLKVLSWFRLVWDLQEPPKEVYLEAKRLKAS